VDPVAFSGSTSFLFDDSSAGGYVHIFGDGEQVWDRMPPEDFELRSAIWWLSQEFGEAIKLDRSVAADPIDKAALERKWFILFASRLIFERQFGPDYKKQLRKHHRGDWHLGDGKVGDWFKRLYDAAKQTVQYKYAESAQKADFVHRNWMRSISTVTAIRTFVLKAPLPQLQDLLK
jgi:hypothetical protein